MISQMYGTFVFCMRQSNFIFFQQLVKSSTQQPTAALPTPSSHHDQSLSSSVTEAESMLLECIHVFGVNGTTSSAHSETIKIEVTPIFGWHQVGISFAKDCVAK